MKIAIASSGLGHVARGIETWALDLASALTEKGVDVVLFAGSRGQVSLLRPEGYGGQAGVRGQREKGQAAGVEGRMGEWISTEGNPVAEQDGLQSSLPPLTSAKNSGSHPVNESSVPLRIVTLDSLKRGDSRAEWLARLTPGFAWRWGLKSDYGWEQFSFWWKLWPELRRGRFDILHVQDPMVADWCRRFRKAGIVRTREILAHGTEETAEFLERFQYVQHLAPWHMRNAPAFARESYGEAIRREADRSAEGKDEGKEEDEPLNTRKDAKGKRAKSVTEANPVAERSPRCRAGEGNEEEKTNHGGHRGTEQRVGLECSSDSQSSSHPANHPSASHWFAIPNFVDTDRFVPADAQMKRVARERLGLPIDAFVAVAVGALKRDHKRVDWLIQEFGEFATKAGDDVRLLLAGASTPDTPMLTEEARAKAGDRIVVMADQPHDRMAEILAAADVFVHAALFEMMPIAFLEALAVGLPIVCHGHPVMRWMLGGGEASGKREAVSEEWEVGGGERLPAGWVVNMTQSWALAAALEDLRGKPDLLREAGAMARARAVTVFSKEVVVEQYIGMYRVVMDERVEELPANGANERE